MIWDCGNTDTVEFGEGISPSQLLLFKEGNDLWIAIDGQSDYLGIADWFFLYDYRVEEFRFADGTVWTSSQLESLGITVEGSEYADTLKGSMISTTADTIYGYEGNDTIYGYDGNDFLDGGEGSDLLYGGTGNDTYIFGTGYGTDTVQENDSTGGNTDTVQLGINPIDVVFAQATNNLDLTIHGTTDKLTVQSWYTGSAYQTEVFTAADGRHLLNTQVAQLIQAMSTFCANNGLANWDQAITNRPQDVQTILAQYWSP